MVKLLFIFQHNLHIYSETFIINAMPIWMEFIDMLGKTSICKGLIARWTPILAWCHMSVFQMTLHVVLGLHCPSTENTDKPLRTKLHFS